MVSMTRNPQSGSNTRPVFGVGSYEYYEQVYTTVGPQEWIALPDAGQCKVTISFPSGAGGAYLEGTTSPPDMLGAVGQEIGISPLGAYSPVHYVIQDEVNADTVVVTQGDTAIRVNVMGGTVGISVRC